jgi:signal transduction histidine kinase
LERELHDGAQQSLIALAVNLQLARDQLDPVPVTARRLLDDVGRDVQRALEQTAKLAQRIYPPLLEAGGLGAALRAAALATGAEARIDVSAAHVPAEVAGAVYFCCLDMLELTGHGGSATIDIQVEDGVLSLEVLAVTTRSEVMVSTARDRIEALGGALTMQPVWQGVRMSGSLPLAR